MVEDKKRTEADVESEIADRLGRAMAYADLIIVEADGYPQMTYAHTFRTLLINAFLQGFVQAVGEIRSADSL